MANTKKVSPFVAVKHVQMLAQDSLPDSTGVQSRGGRDMCAALVSPERD